MSRKEQPVSTSNALILFATDIEEEVSDGPEEYEVSLDEHEEVPSHKPRSGGTRYNPRHSERPPRRREKFQYDDFEAYNAPEYDNSTASEYDRRPLRRPKQATYYSEHNDELPSESKYSTMPRRSETYRAEREREPEPFSRYSSRSFTEPFYPAARQDFDYSPRSPGIFSAAKSPRASTHARMPTHPRQQDSRDVGRYERSSDFSDNERSRREHRRSDMPTHHNKAGRSEQEESHKIASNRSRAEASKSYNEYWRRCKSYSDAWNDYIFELVAIEMNKEEIKAKNCSRQKSRDWERWKEGMEPKWREDFEKKWNNEERRR